MPVGVTNGCKHCVIDPASKDCKNEHEVKFSALSVMTGVAAAWRIGADTKVIGSSRGIAEGVYYVDQLGEQMMILCRNYPG
jgi:hypothetical protein